MQSHGPVSEPSDGSAAPLLCWSMRRRVPAVRVADLRDRSLFQLRRVDTVAEYGSVSLLGVALRTAHRLSGRRLLASRRHEMSQSLSLPYLLRSRKHGVGMTSFDERAYCQWYAERLHTGQGSIVELGSWLGSLTIPLAIGLHRNPPPNARFGRIHAFDLFRWDSDMDSFVRGTRLEGRFAPGDVFLDAYLEELGRWRPLVDAHEGDLSTVAWNAGPIEFLVVDAMKSWRLASNILSEFFAALIPGKSLVFHQDFAHWYTPWIHLLQYRLRDSFELTYDVPRSDGAVFRLVRPLPPLLLEADYGYEDFDYREIEAAFEHSLQLSHPDKHPNIRAAKVKLLIEIGDTERAEAELYRFRSEGFSFESDLRLVADMLDATPS